MTWSVFFLACFIFGFVMSAIGFLSGSAHLHFHGHHIGHGRGAAGKLNFGTIAAFVMWFGGTGSILLRLKGVGLVIAVVISTIGGIAGASVIWMFVTR